jgi:chaperonin GroES
MASKKSKTKKTVAKKPTKKAAKKSPKKSVAKSVVKSVTKSTKKMAAPVKAKTTPRPPVSQISKIQSSRLSPMADGVLVVREALLEKTAGGLYIPPTAQDKPLRGKVVAVGTGRRNKKGQVRPLDVQIGNDVLFGKFSGTEVKIDGHEFLLLKEPDILGICE